MLCKLSINETEKKNNMFPMQKGVMKLLLEVIKFTRSWFCICPRRFD